MRPLRSLVIYAAFVFIGGALLAPWLYWMSDQIPNSVPVLHKLSRYSFPKFVTRAIEILALVGLWPFLRSLQVRGLREIGLPSPKSEWRKLAIGLGLGFLSLALIALAALMTGARDVNPDHSAARFIRFIVQAAASAFVVALLEEILFRGVLFGALRKVHGWISALLVSSAFFAAVHFLDSEAVARENIRWYSGFVALGQMLGGFQPERIVPEIFSLFLVGALLAFAYQKSRSLYFSIGLHAGWVFWLKSYGFLTEARTPGAAWFWGTSKIINGWLAFFVLTALLGFLIKCSALFRRKEDS